MLKQLEDLQQTKMSLHRALDKKTLAEYFVRLIQHILFTPSAQIVCRSLVTKIKKFPMQISLISAEINSKQM